VIADCVDPKDLEVLISPEVLRGHGFPKPKKVAITFAEDHTGKPSYFVYLVFPNATSDSAISWHKIQPMIAWVRDVIQRKDGERHWPYVQVKREKQMRGELF
jgi:hypothetical protein